MLDKSQNNILYSFLVEKKSRIWRHALLISVMAIIAIDSTFYLYSDSLSEIGYKIYYLLFFFLILDLSVIYFNLYILVPKLLLKNKYAHYAGAAILLISFFMFHDYNSEYYIQTLFNISPNIPSDINSTQDFIINIIKYSVFCLIVMMGLSMTVLFKSWLINMEILSSLETKNLRTQLEDMKEQISPAFLSRMLKKAAESAEADPQAASSVLLNLSKILRSQLYDFSRDSVLLNSEVEFLTNYLNLEKVCHPDFDFKIITAEDTDPVFIAPLLFLPFIQESLVQLQDPTISLSLTIQFIVKNNKLKCICTDNGSYTDRDYSFLSNRLNLLYNNQYSLASTNEGKLYSHILEIQICK